MLTEYLAWHLWVLSRLPIVSAAPSGSPFRLLGWIVHTCLHALNINVFALLLVAFADNGRRVAAWNRSILYQVSFVSYIQAWDCVDSVDAIFTTCRNTTGGFGSVLGIREARKQLESKGCEFW